MRDIRTNPAKYAITKIHEQINELRSQIDRQRVSQRNNDCSGGLTCLCLVTTGIWGPIAGSISCCLGLSLIAGMNRIEENAQFCLNKELTSLNQLIDVLGAFLIETRGCQNFLFQTELLLRPKDMAQKTNEMIKSYLLSHDIIKTRPRLLEIVAALACVHEENVLTATQEVAYTVMNEQSYLLGKEPSAPIQ